jgi:hypothetical protein
MYNTFFKDESITVQAQLLLYLIKSKKLKESTSFFGIQKSTKYTKVKLNVFDNLTSVLKVFEKYRKKMSLLHLERYKQQLFHLAI